MAVARGTHAWLRIAPCTVAALAVLLAVCVDRPPVIPFGVVAAAVSVS